MRPVGSFVGQPIRSLQTMLRVIAQEDPRQPSLVPDGIYGEQTKNAVAAFQINHGLPPTGVTDQATWESIVGSYEPALIRVGIAQPLQLHMEPGEVIRKGSREPNVYIIQAVLTVLSDAYSSITPPGLTGILDEATAVSVAAFQELSGLPGSGEVDKVTWRQMALHYPLAAERSRKSLEIL